jgi:LacI family transcriptional regulator
MSTPPPPVELEPLGRTSRVARSTLRRASSPDAGRPPTIYDVARAAGVSHQTVARFLRGYEGIRPATREKVEDALRTLDYRPNLTARSLTTGRSHRIGALTHELDQFGPSKVVQGATAAARDAGFVLDIVTLDMGREESIHEALELLRQQDLAGIIALSSTDDMTRAFEAAQFSVPVVISAEPDDVALDRATELSTVGFPALVAHLADLGHTDFWHIAGPASWSAARNRTRAYEAAIAARGLRSAGVLPGDWSARSGYEAVRDLPSLREATAVVAANDQMALGAMLALAERGLAVPEDISVAGVDDIPDAAYFNPPLTTLRVDFAEQGRAAVAALLAQIDTAASQTAGGMHPELAVRASTAAARARR